MRKNRVYLGGSDLLRGDVFNRSLWQGIIGQVQVSLLNHGDVVGHRALKNLQLGVLPGGEEGLIKVWKQMVRK